jgi:hypothetical protein
MGCTDLGGSHMSERLTSMSTRELFQSLAAIHKELRRRSIVRSSNSPIADYSEVLVCEALNLRREPASVQGHDAVDQEGRKYQIKGRRPTTENPSRQLSVIRGLDDKHFDALAVVLFDEYYSVTRACIAPPEVVGREARYSRHVNGWILHASERVLDQPGVEDITAEVTNASSYAR